MEMDPNGQLYLEFERTPLELLTPDEIYEKADEELLRKLYEDFRLEFKPNGQHAQNLGIYFSMWANTAPCGGLLVIGIRDDCKVEGCSSVSPKRLNELELTGEVYCPDAKYSCKRVLVHRDADGGSDFVLLFRIHYHPTKVVRTVSGGAWVRRANRKKELTTPDEIRELQAEKGEVQFEAEPCGLEYPKAFDKAAVAEFVAAVRAKKGWEQYHSSEDILQLMHLGRLESQKFIPNMACALLFANDPRVTTPGCRVRFLRFEGESEGSGETWNAVKDEFIDGPVPVLLRDTASLLRTQFRTFSRLGTGGKFFTTTEYPEFAWYEALVNACAHRSYGNGLKNSPIFVKMFDDRLVIESPGPFPPFITNENIYEHHAPRNPFLMEAMYYLNFVKMAHEGTRRMRQLMLELALPAPEFRQDAETGHALVRVTLRNNIKQRRVWVDGDVVSLLGAQVAHSLTEQEKRCINFCAEYKRISVSDAVRLVGGDWGTMKKLLTGLVERNILEHVHSKEVLRDPHAHYILKRPSHKP